MSKKQPQSGKEFIQLAEKSDKVREIREGKGSHVVVEFEDGSSVSIPVHSNKTLATGLRQKLLKVFKAAGVILFLLTILWVATFLVV